MTDPDIEAREEMADRIRDHSAAELVDFTRDGFRVMLVRVRTEAAAAELTATGTDAGYLVRTDADAGKLVLEAPRRASEKVQLGGNRL